MSHESKKYEVPEQDSFDNAQEPSRMVSEPLVAVAYPTIQKEQEVESWDSDDAPCRYTIDELNNIIRQGEDDIAKGRFHSHADVQQRMLNRIQSWR